MTSKTCLELLGPTFGPKKPTFVALVRGLGFSMVDQGLGCRVLRCRV